MILQRFKLSLSDEENISAFSLVFDDEEDIWMSLMSSLWKEIDWLLSKDIEWTSVWLGIQFIQFYIVIDYVINTSKLSEIFSSR